MSSSHKRPGDTFKFEEVDPLLFTGLVTVNGGNSYNIE